MDRQKPFYYTLSILCILAYAQIGCVSIPIVNLNGPGGVIVGTDSSGIIFSQQGRDLWIHEGVPSEWFIPDGLNWHISDMYWHAGNSIRLKKANK